MKPFSILICLLVIIIFYSCSNKHLKGIYICEKIAEDSTKTSKNNLTKLALGMLGIDDVCLYTQLEFKGTNTVVLSTVIGQDYPTSYIIDEDYIKVKTDKSDLLFKIKDDKILIGEGYSKGLFKKE